MHTCPACNRRIPEGATKCPQCGRPNRVAPALSAAADDDASANRPEIANEAARSGTVVGGPGPLDAARPADSSGLDRTVPAKPRANIVRRIGAAAAAAASQGDMRTTPSPAGRLAMGSQLPPSDPNEPEEDKDADLSSAPASAPATAPVAISGTAVGQPLPETIPSARGAPRDNSSHYRNDHRHRPIWQTPPPRARMADSAVAVAQSDAELQSFPETNASALPGRVRPRQDADAGAGAGADAHASADNIVGARLAERYEVTRKIGQGGMGAVYEARHLLIGKRVAIKVLLDKYAQRPEVVARLQQEARLASSIGHENIVDITDFGETTDGRTFAVMEYLEGQSLAYLLSREGPLPVGRAVGIARQVAGALGAAHGKGVIHRDIKPENVFVVRRRGRDFVKVLDFGISKAMRPLGEEDDGSQSSSPRLTQTGMVLGTPLYMSPEQARGEESLDHRIDVYAVGVILYEMLTGEVPFKGNNYLSVVSQVLASEAKPPRQVRPDLNIPEAIEAITLKAMAKDRELRYQNMAELDGDMAQHETGGEITAMRRLAKTAMTKPQHGVGSRNRILAWSGGIAILIVAVAIAVSTMLPSRQGGQQAPAAAVGSDGRETTAIAKPLPTASPERQQQQQPQSQSQQQQTSPTMITVEVTSDPPRAQVWWESVNKGTTPISIEFPLGTEPITLTVKHEGYEDAFARFHPTSNQTLPVTLSKRRRTGGTSSRPRPASTDTGAGSPTTDQPAKDRGPTSGGEIKPSPF
ncbi:MAG: protein kinase [Pseudomonadota bacterium]